MIRHILRWAVLASLLASVGASGVARADTPLATVGWARDGSPWTPVRDQLKSDAREGGPCAPNAALLFRVRGSGATYGPGERTGEDPLGSWAVAAGDALIDKGWRVSDMQAVYDASRDDRAAERQVRGQLAQAAARCRARRILVAGYAQGASVLRHVLAHLDRATRRQIAHVDLIAAPAGRVPDSLPTTGITAARGLRAWPLPTIDGALAGLPEQGARLGSTTAPIVLHDFMDPQCSFCRRYVETSLPSLLVRYVRAGEVQLVFDTIAFIGPDSTTAARYATAAGEQNLLWPFMASFYQREGQENSGYVTPSFLRATAATVPGLDPDAAQAAAGSGAVKATLGRSRRLWLRFIKLNGTPSFLIGRRGGSLRPEFIGAFRASELSTPIEQLLHPGG